MQTYPLPAKHAIHPIPSPPPYLPTFPSLLSPFVSLPYIPFLLPILSPPSLPLPTSPLSSPPLLPLHAVLPGPPVRIDAVSATKTTAVLEVELSSVGTPPLMVFVDLTSHPELVCCPNQTTYQSGDTVRFSLEGLSERTTYTVNVFARNLAGQGSGEQHSFMTGELVNRPGRKLEKEVLCRDQPPV